MDEVWRVIDIGTRNKEISSWGRVRSLVTGKFLKPQKCRGGYVAVAIYNPAIKKSRSYTIHRLVAMAFLPPIEGKHHVNHKNFDKHNNHIDNLEWVTQRENNGHYYKNKFKSIVSDEDVLFIRTNIEKLGPRNISQKLGIREGYVMSVANGSVRRDVYPELIREKRPSAPQPVYKYDLQGVMVAQYPSIMAAAKADNVRLFGIQSVLTGIKKTYNGFIYSTVMGQLPKFKGRLKCYKKAGRKIQKIKDGIVVDEYKTIVAAADSVNVTPTNIRRVLSGVQKSAGGFFFSYDT